MNIKELLNNVNNGFKNFFKTENLEKLIGFLSFEAISFYFTLSMYLDIGTDFRGKVAMGIATVAVEAFKVMLITSMSGCSYAMSFYNKRFKSGKEYITVYLKHLKNFSLAFIFYLITASVSFLATVGFGLATVYQYNQINQIIDISSEKEFSQNQVLRIQQQIIEYEALNTDDRNVANQFISTSLVFTDMDDRTQRLNKNYYIEEAEKRFKKIEDRNILITELNKNISNIQIELQNLEKQISEDNKENKKSIFQLMEESINYKFSASNIMLTIVVLLALVIEIGLIYTSPKISKIDEEKDFEMYPNHKFMKKRKFKKQEIEVDEDFEETDAEAKTEEVKEIKIEIEETDVEAKTEESKEIKIEIEETNVEAKTEKVKEIKVEIEETDIEAKTETEESKEIKIEKAKTEVEEEIKKAGVEKNLTIKEKEKHLAEAKKEVETKIKERLAESRKEQEDKQNKQLLYVIDKLFDNTIKGEDLISLNELSKLISIPKDKLEKVCKYLNYIGVVSYNASNRTWKPKFNKEEAIIIVKQKLIKSKT